MACFNFDLLWDVVHLFLAVDLHPIMQNLQLKWTLLVCNRPIAMNSVFSTLIVVSALVASFLVVKFDFGYGVKG